MSNSHIVKRKGHTETFDNKKLYASIYASCLASHEKIEIAEKTAEKVVNKFVEWLEEKNTIITSNDIRRKASEILEGINPDAAYSYIKHRIIW
jgi:transcriptional regulator NrdR family protein